MEWEALVRSPARERAGARAGKPPSASAKFPLLSAHLPPRVASSRSGAVVLVARASLKAAPEREVAYRRTWIP